MRKLLIGLLVMGSFSAFAQAKKEVPCVAVANEQIMRTEIVTNKIVALLSDNDITSLVEIQKTVLELAKLACEK